MTTNGDVLIRVENLQKAFGDFHALNGITEEIHKGEVVVIIGPSGSGDGWRGSGADETACPGRHDHGCCYT